ncbi:MAG: molybdopterin molybdotransferase MoeA [Nitrososphaerales archaeon]
MVRKKMSGFPDLTTVDKALEKIRENINLSVEVEEVPLSECSGRILAEDIISPVDVPPFDRSAVEGYAVVSADTFSASTTNPIELSVIGRAEAGQEPSQLPEVTSGKAVEIFTGAPLPYGADAVVMLEQTKRIGEKVLIYSPAAKWRNVSRQGEDFTKGKPILLKGTRIKPWHIGALASANITKVKVYRKLKIGILSTGSEIKEIGEELRSGEIVNSSRPMLTALVKERNCIPVNLGTVEDNLEKITERLKLALKICDIIITTGGTSLGEKDLVPEAVQSLGSPGLIVHGIAMRPAKPTGAGLVDGKPIFILSGYPVSALIGFEVFVDEAINYIYGTRPEPRPRVKGKLTRKLATPVGYRSFVRARVTRDSSGYLIEPLRLTGSGLLSSMTKANALIVVEENVEGFDEGDEVEAYLFQPIDAPL